YIPLNNKHNEPTQGDIGETSNELTQATRNEFEELYASANEELLQRLYKSSHTAKEMIWHATGKCTKPGKMKHPVDSRAWKNIDTKYSDFTKEPRNVRLGLAADGFNPFGNLSQAYIMWPVILTTYNLPTWLCMKESSLMLILLIPGLKSLGKDIDVYLRPLIEDLKSGQGYKACPTCNKDTPSVHVLNKIAYVGHIRFLKKPHKWRSSREFNAQTDNRDPPKEFGRDEILCQLHRFPTRLTGKRPSFGGVKIKHNVLAELNWTKRSIFYELEYWLGIRSGLWLGQTKNEKCLKPQATYSFTPENRKKFCQFIKGVELPDGFGSCFKHKVTDNDTNKMGLKSHDCYIMMQRLLPYGLQNYLPDKIAKPIIELCSLFKQICSATLMEDDILKAQIKVVDILCDLELIYPPALFDIIHFVIYLPLEALEGGPICPWWMYPFERYMKKLKGNDKDPEVSITSELFALACGPTWTLILINSCVVDGVRYVVHSRDERRITQNRGICSPGPDGEMYYGQLQEIFEFKYLLFKVVLFRMLADVARSYGGDGGGEDRPLHTIYPAVAWVALLTEYDLRPHMESPDWTEINASIQQQLQKAYNTNKAAFKAQHWIIDPTTGTYNVKKIRRERPEKITANEWDKPQPLRSTRRSLTHSSWQTLLTRNSLGMRTDEMRRLDAMGTYTDDEINRLARGGKQRGQIGSVGRFESGGASGSGGCGDEEEGADHQDDEDEDGDGDT
nr:hypothetical protein [Tanacetum cinerariifolium]